MEIITFGWQRLLLGYRVEQECRMDIFSCVSDLVTSLLIDFVKSPLIKVALISKFYMVGGFPLKKCPQEGITGSIALVDRKCVSETPYISSLSN